MMKNGSLAVAIVHRQVVVVKGKSNNSASARPGLTPSISHSRPFAHKTRTSSRRLYLHTPRGPSLHRVGLPKRKDPRFRYPHHLPVRVHPLRVSHATTDRSHLLRVLRDLDRGGNPSNTRVNHRRNARAPFRRIRRVPTPLLSQSGTMR